MQPAGKHKTTIGNYKKCNDNHMKTIENYKKTQD